MRVCEYKVIGMHNGESLSDTVHGDENDPVEEEEDVELPDALDEEEEFDGEEEEFEEEKPVTALVKTKKPVETKKKEIELTPAPKKSNKHRFDSKDTVELLKESIEELRQYAGKNLGIIGASKILGGKVALIAKILEVRG
jgi:hypothetical protein